MSNKLCYADAVKLLDGGDKGIIAALDKLTGGLLLAGTGGGGHLLLSMFDVQGELGRLNRELVRGVGDRLRGLGRFGRTERHALDPINREMDARELPDSECEVTSAFGVLSEERAVSVANAIIRLWVCSSRPAGGDDL